VVVAFKPKQATREGAYHKMALGGVQPIT
jgi:hypothetical protein